MITVRENTVSGLMFADRYFRADIGIARKVAETNNNGESARIDEKIESDSQRKKVRGSCM